MSGAGLIEMLAARLARRAPREAAPELRQVLQSRMLRPEDIGDATRRDLSTWGPRGVAGDEILDRPIQVTPTSVDDLLANNPQFLEDPERAAEFAARSTPLPPVMMRGGKLIDGRHRLEAARIRGNDTIDAVDLDQFERPSAPSLRSALSEVNAARTGPDAGTAPNGIAPASFDESTTWYRGGRPGSGRTFLTRDRAMAERFARDLHGTDEVAAGNVAGGRQMVVDWSGRPWDAGPSGWSTDHMAEVARREGYDSVLLQNVESVRGSPADELVLLNENQFRTAPDGRPVQAAAVPPEIAQQNIDAHFGEGTTQRLLADDSGRLMKEHADRLFREGEDGAAYATAIGMEEWALARQATQPAATYRPARGVRMAVGERGHTYFTFDDSFTPGGGSAQEAQRVMRAVHRALLEDIAKYRRPEYVWQAEERLERFYRSAMRSNTPPGYTFSEANRTMRLTRTGPNAGPAQTVGALPSATSEGVTTYRGENTHVRIQPFPRRGVTEVTWDVNGGRAPSGLADRARLEQEGIDTALRAMQQHAAQNGDVTYTVHGANGALARRYRRMAQERAEAAGFTFEETPSGGLIFRRADSANRSDGNALQRALRERMERE